jgi:hypothetical protein
MKTPLQRIAALRTTLQRQARAALAAAEHELDEARKAEGAIADKSVAKSLASPLSAAELQLHETVGAAARAAAATAERERDARAEVAQTRTREQRQIQVLVDRATAQKKKDAAHREQLDSDDRAQRRKGTLR